MAKRKTLDQRLQEYLDNIEDTIERGTVTVIINAVREGAQAFKKVVEQATPQGTTLGLLDSLTLSRTFNKGQYGYRLLFDGYADEDRNRAFQVIANTLNAGRSPGIAESGRGISKLEAIRFITNSLSVLRTINEDINKRIKFGGWSVSDTEIKLNDGTRLTKAAIDTAMREIDGGR